MRYALTTLGLAPVLLPQALWTRWRTPRLGEPEGPRHGTLGSGPPLGLLVAGDSAAAGVGARSQDEALCGQLAQRLAARCAFLDRLIKGQENGDVWRELSLCLWMMSGHRIWFKGLSA